MIFNWLRTRRRRLLLAEPFPVRWLGFLDRNVAHYRRLSSPEQSLLRDIARILIAEKRWYGRGGLFVTEEMKITIAAQAALLLLGTHRSYYSRVRDICVFPTEFRTPVAEDDWEDDGLSETPLAGQAVDHGPVLLAWDQVLPEGQNLGMGQNVVMHEFAHQLDFAEGITRRGPKLGDPSLESRWHYVMSVAFEDHCRAIKRGGVRTFFTPYSAASEAEFFAAATEAFYCRSKMLKRLHPEMYELFMAYYRVDPTMWLAHTIRVEDSNPNGEV